MNFGGSLRYNILSHRCTDNNTVADMVTLSDRRGFLCNSSAAAAKPYRWSWLVNGTNLDRNKDCRCGRRGSTSSTAQQIQLGRRATSHSLGRTILHKSRWCSLSRRFWKNNLHLRNINGTYINYWAFTIHESKQTTTWNRLLLLQAAADGHGML